MAEAASGLLIYPHRRSSSTILIHHSVRFYRVANLIQVDSPGRHSFGFLRRYGGLAQAKSGGTLYVCGPGLRGYEGRLLAVHIGGISVNLFVEKC